MTGSPQPVGVGLRSPDRAYRSEDAVRDEEGGTDPADDLHQPRQRGEERTPTRDADDDEHGIRQGADQHDGEHVLAAQPLAQHEGVLCADRDDERQPEAEAAEGGEDRGCHAATVGFSRTASAGG